MVSNVMAYLRYLALMSLFALGLSGVAQAQTGNIDPTNKWAWGTNVGWINFRPSDGGVTVYSDHLEGYAWAENIGWIRLGTHTGGGAHTYGNTSHTDYGVNHDGSGNLSGYAWGTNVGWINFNPSHIQVTIDLDTGIFDGYAWGENVGWIHFQNASPAYKVATLDVVFTNGAHASLSFTQTSPSPPQDNWPFGQFSLNSSSAGATFNAVTVSLGGSYSGLSGANPFRLYAHDTNAFSSASAIGSDAAASGGSVTFGSLSDDLPSGIRYYWVTADLSASASGTLHGTIADADDLDITDGTTSGSSNYGVLNTGGDVSLPVELSSFAASVHADGIHLSWTTESEVDNLGFHLYRAEDKEGGIGEYVQINRDLIPGMVGVSTRTSYAFVDGSIPHAGIYWYRLEDVDVDGRTTLHDPISVTVLAPAFTSVPTAYALHQNTPNPFNPVTTIAYDLPEACDLVLTIYSSTGQQVATLVSGPQEAGHYEVVWDGRRFGDGIYVYRLEAGGFMEARRMILLK